jgi:muramoyltetrapeptide carboxypeptidase
LDDEHCVSIWLMLLMKRRTVLTTMASSLAIATGAKVSGSQASATEPLISTAQLIKPKRLRKGMTIGLVAPASNAPENEGVRFARDVITSLGFKVKEGKHLYKRNEYLAGTDKERAEDVNQMFEDEQVDGIFCVRGGWGSPRILPYLDYDLIAQNPKVFMGYSDITAILNALVVKAGLVGFHGPIAKQNFTEYTLQEFKKVLMHPTNSTLIASPPPFEAREGWVEEENRLTRFVSGKASGRLMGGNLSLLTKLIGTPYEPDFKGAILVLEDVGESPYRIDGMLTHLWLAGKLQQVAGIAIGKFTDTDYSQNTYSVEEVIHQRCVPLGVPVIRGLMIGHVDDMSVVPLGIQAELDVDAGTLRLLESAVKP